MKWKAYLILTQTTIYLLAQIYTVPSGHTRWINTDLKPRESYEIRRCDGFDWKFEELHQFGIIIGIFYQFGWESENDQFHQVQREAPPLIQWPTTALYQLLSCVKDIRGKHFPCIACFKKYLGLLPYPSTPPIHFAKCTSLRYNPFFRGGTAKDDELTSAQLRARHAIPGNSRGKLVLLR